MKSIALLFFLVLLSMVIPAVCAEDYVSIGQWGTKGTGDGQFNHPMGIAVDKVGNVYVADTDNDRVQKFRSDGTLITKFQIRYGQPQDIAVNQLGNIYVTTPYDGILKYAQDGTFLTGWGAPDSPEGDFSSPYGVAVDTTGNVYVAEYGKDRILVFTSDGSFITKWGAKGIDMGKLDRPQDIAIDTAGNAYVVEYGDVDPVNDERIQKFTPNGTFMMKWGPGSLEVGWWISYPQGIAVDTANHVYVVSEFTDQVLKFASDGTFITKWITSGDEPFEFPTDIAVDAAGNVYITEASGTVKKFARQGATPIPTTAAISMPTTAVTIVATTAATIPPSTTASPIQIWISVFGIGIAVVAYITDKARRKY